MKKLKVVNKERFEVFLSVVGLAALLIIIAVVPRPKSPIEKWHDAIDEGKTWNEYMENGRC